MNPRFIALRGAVVAGALVITTVALADEMTQLPQDRPVPDRPTGTDMGGDQFGRTDKPPALLGDDDVKDVIMSWPSPSKMVAMEMITRYGMPDEITASHIIWWNNEPWLKTTVFRDTVPHSFPRPHVDVIEQVVPLRVPPELFDEIAMFDGSIIIDRTKGEVAARGEREEMNFLALNLVKDIVDGRRTVEQARMFAARTAIQVLDGQKPTYIAALQFRPVKNPDVDNSIIKDGKVIEEARK